MEKVDKRGGKRPGAGRKKSGIEMTTLSVWIPIQVKLAFKKYAQKKGTTASKLVLKYVDECLNKNNNNLKPSNDEKV